MHGSMNVKFASEIFIFLYFCIDLKRLEAHTIRNSGD